MERPQQLLKITDGEGKTKTNPNQSRLDNRLSRIGSAAGAGGLSQCVHWLIYANNILFLSQNFLCNPGYLATHYIEQVGLMLEKICLLLLPMGWIKGLPSVS